MKPPAAEPPIHYEGHTPGVERVASVTHPIKPKVAEIAGPVQLPHEQVGGCKPLGQGEFRTFRRPSGRSYLVERPSFRRCRHVRSERSGIFLQWR
jgi:hypothetical protein